MPITQALLWLLQNKKKYTNVDKFEFFGLFFFSYRKPGFKYTSATKRKNPK